MSLITMSEAKFEAKLALAHSSSLAAGIGQVADHIREAAGEAFKEGDDNYARQLRGIADVVDKMHRKETKNADQYRDALQKITS